jgi:preprotein translocase subunit YajC
MFETIANAMSGLSGGGGGTGGSGGGAFGAMIPLVLMFVIFYFLLIRPQQKKAKDQQSWISRLSKGDRVVTSGGLHGEITGLTDTIVTLEIAPKIRVKVNRSAIAASAGPASSSDVETPAQKK